MLNSNVCIYPSLVFHEVEEINRINLNNFYRAIDDAITMGYTNETYPTETLTTKSQSWSYPCGQADAEPRLYLMRPCVNTTLLNVGDYFSMNISIANCDTQKSHNITSLKVYFNQLEDHMTSYNITFNGADGVVAPGATKKNNNSASIFIFFAFCYRC